MRRVLPSACAKWAPLQLSASSAGVRWMGEGFTRRPPNPQGRRDPPRAPPSASDEAIAGTTPDYDRGMVFEATGSQMPTEESRKRRMQELEQMANAPDGMPKRKPRPRRVYDEDPSAPRPDSPREEPAPPPSYEDILNTKDHDPVDFSNPFKPPPSPASQAHKNMYKNTKPPPVNKPEFPKSYLDLSEIVDDDVLASKLQSQANATTRDPGLDAALNVKDAPDRRRTVPKPRSRMDEQTIHPLSPDGGEFWEDKSALGYDMKSTSTGFQSLMAHGGEALHKYDWFRNPTLRKWLYSATSYQTPPDAGDKLAHSYSLLTKKDRGWRSVVPRLFSDWDWADKQYATHTLMCYRWGDWLLVTTMCGLTYWMYHYQLDTEAMIWYDEYLGLDLRMVPGAHKGIYIMIAVGVVQFLRHPLVVSCVVGTRLWRIFRRRPLGPP